MLVDVKTIPCFLFVLLVVTQLLAQIHINDDNTKSANPIGSQQDKRDTADPNQTAQDSLRKFVKDIQDQTENGIEDTEKTPDEKVADLFQSGLKGLSDEEKLALGEQLLKGLEDQLEQLKQSDELTKKEQRDRMKSIEQYKNALLGAIDTITYSALAKIKPPPGDPTTPISSGKGPGKSNDGPPPGVAKGAGKGGAPKASVKPQPDSSVKAGQAKPSPGGIIEMPIGTSKGPGKITPNSDPPGQAKPTPTDISNSGSAKPAGSSSSKSASTKPHATGNSPSPVASSKSGPAQKQQAPSARKPSPPPQPKNAQQTGEERKDSDVAQRDSSKNFDFFNPSQNFRPNSGKSSLNGKDFARQPGDSQSQRRPGNPSGTQTDSRSENLRPQTPYLIDRKVFATDSHNWIALPQSAQAHLTDPLQAEAELRYESPVR